MPGTAEQSAQVSVETADLVVRGARTHNLKNIDLTLPIGKLVVITGVSGSGKSSLAFDTIYAEGQRRYVESLREPGALLDPRLAASAVNGEWLPGVDEWQRQQVQTGTSD